MLAHNNVELEEVVKSFLVVLVHLTPRIFKQMKMQKESGICTLPVRMAAIRDVTHILLISDTGGIVYEIKRMENQPSRAIRVTI